MNATAINLSFPNGDVQGLCIATNNNWAGKVLRAPRKEQKALFAREEVKRAGVYFLLFDRKPDGEKPMAYIGVGEDVGKRVGQHPHEDWVKAIVFVSRDDEMTKSHFQYLEGRLIKEAGEVGRFELENDQNSGAKLSEAGRSEMEEFLCWVRQFLAVLGCDMLTPLLKSGESAESSNALTYTVKGIIAKGHRTQKGFVVFKDSEAVAETTPCTRLWTKQERDKLLADGKLKHLADKLVFTADVEFSSPTAAAEVVSGAKVNGLTTWRNFEHKTLKDLESAV